MFLTCVSLPHHWRGAPAGHFNSVSQRHRDRCREHLRTHRIAKQNNVELDLQFVYTEFTLANWSRCQMTCAWSNRQIWVFVARTPQSLTEFRCFDVAWSKEHRYVPGPSQVTELTSLLVTEPTQEIKFGHREDPGRL